MIIKIIIEINDIMDLMMWCDLIWSYDESDDGIQSSSSDSVYPKTLLWKFQAPVEADRRACCPPINFDAQQLP